MSMFEVSFKIDYEYPFIDLSKKFPELRFNMWCLWGRELLEVPVLDATVASHVEKEIKRAGRLIDKVTGTGNRRIFMIKCTCDLYDSVWNIAGDNQFVDAPPAVYHGGWGFFRLITFEEDNIRPLFKDLNSRGRTELLGKREIPLEVLPSSMWVNSVFSDLTDKQKDALLKAQQYGYYTSPRNITTDSIARSLGISRSTYEEHLRKAENKVIASIAPYLELYGGNLRSKTGSNVSGAQ